MGVTYIQADGEAEAYASEMCRNGSVDYVVTEDVDSLYLWMSKNDSNLFR